MKQVGFIESAYIASYCNSHMSRFQIQSETSAKGGQKRTTRISCFLQRPNITKYNSYATTILWRNLDRIDCLIELLLYNYWVMRKLLKLRRLCQGWIRRVIGNGEDTFLWTDNWHGGTLWVLRTRNLVRPLLWIEDRLWKLKFLLSLIRVFGDGQVRGVGLSWIS